MSSYKDNVKVMQTRHRVLIKPPTNNGSDSDEMRVGRNINARHRKSSDRKGVMRFRKLLFFAAFPAYAMFIYQQNLHSQLEDYHYLITPPSSLHDMEENQSSHYAKFGEVPEEMLGLIPTGIKIMPIKGTWKKFSWMNKKSVLHGNFKKVICHLFDENQTSPIHSLPLSENSFPYRVLVRPIRVVKGRNNPRRQKSDGVGNEFLAYNLALELGIHKIPTQTIIAPPSSKRDPMNVQSLLRGVHFTFIHDWINCLPNTTAVDNSFSTKPPLRGNDNGMVLNIGNREKNETQMIRLNFVHANTQAVWKLCFRNITHFDIEWGTYCLQHQPLIRQCRQEEIAQLLEMAMFDALIYNRDRLHRGPNSNNIHWLWPPTEGNDTEPSVNTEDPLQLVWIDHQHFTFTEQWEVDTGASGRIMSFFKRECIFPDNLLRQLFPSDARSDHPRLSKRVLERLTPKIWVTFNETEGWRSVKERAQTVAHKLTVVNRQLKHIREAVAECARKHNPPGAVDVMHVR